MSMSKQTSPYMISLDNSKYLILRMITGVHPRALSKAEKRRNTDQLVQVFELNYPHLLSFLPAKDHPTLKLVCRGVYYLSVTSDIWLGLREEVVDCKMQHFEDIDFTEEAPKATTKQEKQIRIHSLKKSTAGVRIRQASNIKEKKATLNTINNELPFRATEIGFKRLLKTGNPRELRVRNASQLVPQQTLSELVQIPQQLKRQDLIINVKDPWSVNVQRAGNLCGVVKRWNEFHHRLMAQLKEGERDIAGLIKKCIKVDRQLTEYLRMFEGEPYCSVKQLLVGSEQQLLIDEQLNKLGRIFMTGHSQLVNLAGSMQAFISKSHEACVKMDQHRKQKQRADVLQFLSSVEETTEHYRQISKSSPLLIKILSKSLFQIVDALLEEVLAFQIDVDSEIVTVYSADIRHIRRKNQFFQILYESLENCLVNMLQLGEGGQEENIGISLLAAKFKSCRTIAHHLCSIARYFSKLVKQLAARQKKGKENSKATVIRNFLQSYESYSSGSTLLDWKNPQRAEKQVGELKVRVGALKGLIQGE